MILWSLRITSDHQGSLRQGFTTFFSLGYVISRNTIGWQATGCTLWLQKSTIVDNLSRWPKRRFRTAFTPCQNWTRSFWSKPWLRITPFQTRSMWPRKDSREKADPTRLRKSTISLTTGTNRAKRNKVFLRTGTKNERYFCANLSGFGCCILCLYVSVLCFVFSTSFVYLFVVILILFIFNSTKRFPEYFQAFLRK